MHRDTALALGLGAAVAGVGLVVWWRRRDGGAVADVTGATWLLARHRANGVHSRLQAFLSRLDDEGVTYRGKRYAVTVGVDGGVRTQARQLELYAQGRARTASHPSTWQVVDQARVVTNAYGANGPHTEGRAVDVWVVLPGGAALLQPSQSPDFEGLYAALGAVGESMGLKWGGRFVTLVDRPHFEVTGA